MREIWMSSPKKDLNQKDNLISLIILKKKLLLKKIIGMPIIRISIRKGKVIRINSLRRRYLRVKERNLINRND